MKRKRRQDYINIQRKLLKLLADEHLNLQVPFYPFASMTNQQLAMKIGVNEKTIRRHKKNITARQWKKIESLDFWEKLREHIL